MQIRETGLSAPTRWTTPSAASSTPSEPVDSLAPAMEQPLKSFLADRKALTSHTETLKSTAADPNDPIAARVAYELLRGSLNHFSWEGRAELSGLIPLATARICDVADYVHSYTQPEKTEIEPALAALANGPVAPAALDAVLRLARDLKFPEQKELCRKQLESWHQAGLFQVEGGSDFSQPGLVLGSTLVLTPLPQATLEVLAAIPTRDYVYARPLEHASGIDRLEQLARDNPALAGSIMADIVGRDLDRPTHQKLVQILSRARESEPLKKLLEPHLERLVDYTERAQSHGLIHRGWGTGEWQAAHYDFLTQVFPDTADDKLPGRLAPLMSALLQPNQGVADVVKRLWEEKPALVQPTLDAITGQHPSTPLREPVMELLSLAADKYRWRPDSRELDWLASRVYQPQWKEDSLFHWAGGRAKEFPATLDLLQKMGVGQEVKLPDEKGQWVDLGTYALGRLLNDPDFVKPEAVAQRLFEGTDPNVVSVYRFTPPERHVESVFAEVAHGVANPRSKYSVDNRVVTGLGFLAGQARNDEALRDRLVTVVHGQPSHYFTGMGPILDPLRFRGHLADLEAGQLKDGVTPEQMTSWLLKFGERASWDKEELGPLFERTGQAWTRLQKEVYAGQWPARATEVDLPPPFALEALERIRSQFPAEAHEDAWNRLESMLSQLGTEDEPGKRLQTAFEMLDTQQAYLAPNLAGGVQLEGDRVQIGGVNLRTRKNRS